MLVTVVPMCRHEEEEEEEEGEQKVGLQYPCVLNQK
jgi:hypothetical protein